jgi:hypothetical protein
MIVCSLSAVVVDKALQVQHPEMAHSEPCACEASKDAVSFVRSWTGWCPVRIQGSSIIVRPPWVTKERRVASSECAWCGSRRRIAALVCLRTEGLAQLFHGVNVGSAVRGRCRRDAFARKNVARVTG